MVYSILSSVATRGVKKYLGNRKKKKEEIAKAKREKELKKQDKINRGIFRFTRKDMELLRKGIHPTHMKARGAAGRITKKRLKRTGLGLK